MCPYVCTHTHHTYIYINIYAYKHICMWESLPSTTHIRVYMYTYIYEYIRIHVRIGRVFQVQRIYTYIFTYDRVYQVQHSHFFNLSPFSSISISFLLSLSFSFSPYTLFLVLARSLSSAVTHARSLYLSIILSPPPSHTQPPLSQCVCGTCQQRCKKIPNINETLTRSHTHSHTRIKACPVCRGPIERLLRIYS